mgnify:CR=1 FL=1
MNIGIELLENIKILHDRGFLHRDLKPDNIIFGPMCEENIKFKNNIGIIDFGNSKLLMKKNGLINYTTKIYECRGTRTFSSNNALLGKDTKKIQLQWFWTEILSIRRVRALKKVFRNRLLDSNCSTSAQAFQLRT